MLRRPGRVLAASVSDEIVHGRPVPDVGRHRRYIVPNDRPIDGVDQSDFFIGQTEKSAREGLLIWCADRLQAVKWRNFKVHFYWQETIVAPPIKLGIPLLFNLYTNPREAEDKVITDSWIFGPGLKQVAEFEHSVQRHALIAMGSLDPYTPKWGAKPCSEPYRCGGDRLIALPAILGVGLLVVAQIEDERRAANDGRIGEARADGVDLALEGTQRGA
jgi:hypothetical protein